MPKFCVLCGWQVFSGGYCYRHYHLSPKGIAARERAKNKPRTKVQIKKVWKPHRRKPTGEAAMFLEIWSQRPHVCVNCREGLGKEPRTFYFSHIIPKGRRPDLRLNPDNIQLLCFECHRAYDQGTKAQYEARKK